MNENVLKQFGQLALKLVQGMEKALEASLGSPASPASPENPENPENPSSPAPPALRTKSSSGSSPRRRSFR